MATGQINAVVSEDISLELDLNMKTITVRNGNGDYVTLNEREFADMIGVVGSHAWAYGLKGDSNDNDAN